MSLSEIYLGEGMTFLYLSPPFPSPLPTFLSPLSLPSFPLEVEPLKSSYGYFAVSSSRRVWGRAQAEIEFGAF